MQFNLAARMKHSLRFRGILLALFVGYLPMNGFTWQLDFENEPLGEWDIPHQNSLFGKSHPSIQLEVVEPSQKSPENNKVLKITGDRRGFRNRNEHDFDPPLFKGKAGFDFLLHNGAFNFILFESARDNETRNKSLRFFVNSAGAIISRTSEQSSNEAIRHGSLVPEEWYRVEIDISLDENGEGHYSFKVQNLHSGEEIPLSNTEAISMSNISGFSGIDVDLMQDASVLFIDNIYFQYSDDTKATSQWKPDQNTQD